MVTFCGGHFLMDGGGVGGRTKSGGGGQTAHNFSFMRVGWGHGGKTLFDGGEGTMGRFLTTE